MPFGPPFFINFRDPVEHRVLEQVSSESLVFTDPGPSFWYIISSQISYFFRNPSWTSFFIILGRFYPKLVDFGSQKASQYGIKIFQKINISAKAPFWSFTDRFGIILAPFLFPLGALWVPFRPIWLTVGLILDNLGRSKAQCFA